jgi:hypothetical protein
VGQVSLPVLNRTGYSMFWSSVWDSKHNYNKLFKQDIILKRIIGSLFNERFFFKNQFINLKALSSTNVFNSFENWNIFKSDKSFISFFNVVLKKRKTNFIYPLKVWIIRSQGWLIIFFSIYSPFKAVIKELKEEESNVYEKILTVFEGYFNVFLFQQKYNNMYNSNNRLIKSF